MTPGNEHAQIEKLLDRNAELLAENNKLLKIHRNGLWAFWIRVVWYLVLIGLPFALYFYVLEPYFNALGANYEVFRAGVSEIPGLKGLDQILESLNQRPQ